MGSGYKTFTAGAVLTASDVQNYLQDQSVMVFGGTAARSSAIGTANFEEGMLTYLTDVDKLQVYTGATFADVYPPATSNQGLTLINTTSFSGVTSQSVNTVFNSTYQNYRVIISLTSAATDFNYLRLRVSGSDNSTASSYISERLRATSTTVTGLRATDSYLLIGAQESATYEALNIEIFSPAEARPTQFLVNKTERQADSDTEFGAYGGYHNQSTAYDGFTIYGTKSTSGTIRVYGYNN